MNKRNVVMVTPNNIAPLKSNFCCDPSLLVLEISCTSFSFGINLKIMKIRITAIGIIEKNVSLHPKYWTIVPPIASPRYRATSKHGVNNTLTYC